MKNSVNTTRRERFLNNLYSHRFENVTSLSMKQILDINPVIVKMKNNIWAK